MTAVVYAFYALNQNAICCHNHEDCNVLMHACIRFVYDNESQYTTKSYTYYDTIMAI